MQQPLSASQLGLNKHSSPKDRSSSKKLFKGVLTIIVIVLILLLARVIYWQYVTKLPRTEATTNGVSYSLKFSPKSNIVKKEGKDYLEGTDPLNKTGIAVTVTRSSQSNDCTQTGATIKVIKDIDVEGESHKLCGSEEGGVYLMRFRHNNQWFEFLVMPTETATVAPNVDTVAKIASSIELK